LSLGLELLRKGKLGVMPPVVRQPSHVAPRAKPDQVAYYPGCSLHSVSSEFDISTRAVFGELGVELVEPKGWTCCGSTPAHTTDHLLAMRLPLNNLALIEREGFPQVVAPCASCFSRFKSALWDMRQEPQLKERLDEERGYNFRGSVEVKHILQLLEEWRDEISGRVKVPLEGLRVVSYYGCLLTRPPKVTQAQEPEYPMVMDHLVEALGATTLDWSYKTDCCGATLSLSKKELALELSAKILRDAKAVGADLVAVACPLCHTNLDSRQGQMGLEFQVPILYITQLVGLGMGLKRLGLEKHLVDPRGVLRDRGLLG
ncbi:MAG: CoB--CoM heterodisulfide reductase iron-sulfur subunit B family protein, partial [Chloroflexota bacterium]|nr:CoB--CoM heterodisulfide reductase iron-sulfur subunit B family protein [Chloroflexota bacterium]